jgi:large subunit ribosomal protein L13
MIVIDATDLLLGRMATYAARRLLEGEEVSIIHAEEVAISGSKASILSKYRHRRERRSIVNPARHGPFYPRKPEAIVRRSIRGMLPYKKAKGREAFRRLRVYSGVPKELEGKAGETIEEAKFTKLRVPRYLKLKDLSTLLGYTGASVSP